METETSSGYHDPLNRKRKLLLNESDLSNSEDETSKINDESGIETIEEFCKDGTRIKKIQNKQTHKVTITEEKMSYALRSIEQMDINNKNEDNDTKNPTYQFTDELKSSMVKLSEKNEIPEKLLRAELAKKLMKDPIYYKDNYMQILPWIPNVNQPINFEFQSNEPCSDKCQSDNSNKINDDRGTNYYRVEEPCDMKNLLKRRYSEMNKISIEEVKQKDESSKCQMKHSNSNNYLVELADDVIQSNFIQTCSLKKQNKKNQTDKDNSKCYLNSGQNVIITEVKESPENDLKNLSIPVIEEDVMDI